MSLARNEVVGSTTDVGIRSFFFCVRGHTGKPKRQPFNERTTRQEKSRSMAKTDWMESELVMSAGRGRRGGCKSF